MTKTKEELNKLKQDYEKLTSELIKLSEDELKEVTGGAAYMFEKVGYVLSKEDEKIINS